MAKDKKNKRKIRFVIGAPEKDASKRYISGKFCPLVALVRVTTKRQFDKDLGIAPLCYIDKKDGRAKANLVLQVIRWDSQYKQFVMEHRIFLCPVDRYGRERDKDRQLRVRHQQRLEVGGFYINKDRKPILHSEMLYRAANYLSEDVDRFIDLFEIPYAMDDAKQRKPEPKELQELPRTLPDFRILVPEKATYQVMVTQEVKGQQVEDVKEVVATPRFHGNIQFLEVRERTAPEIQERGLLDITNLEVDCCPMLLWADIVRLHGWSAVHISALAGISSGLRVNALNRLDWAFTNVAPMTDKDQRFDMWRRWRELVTDDELLSKHEELVRFGPAKAWAAMVYHNIHGKGFELIKGVGPVTAKKLRDCLLNHESDFKNWINQYPVLTSMVSEVRDEWVKKEEPVTVSDSEPGEEEKTDNPSPSDDGYAAF